MFCRYCGNEVVENTKICTKCGKPIFNEAVPNKVHTFEPNEIIRSKNKKAKKPKVGICAVIIVCFLVFGGFCYSKISSQDVDRGYPGEQTVLVVKGARGLNLNGFSKQKGNYIIVQRK